jgi:hypothetical protein
MPRPICLFTGQWADLPLEVLAKKAAEFGYDGLELACWGDHFDVARCNQDKDYAKKHWSVLQDHGVASFAISTHLVGQAVCDKIDERHKAILSSEIWGDGRPEGVQQRAAKEVIETGKAARKFFDAAPAAVKQRLKQTGRTVVNGFTGSSIWHLLYSFPPVTKDMIEAGYKDFATRWTPILKEFEKRVFNVHVKDVWWAEHGAAIGVFGGHADFGVDGRYWDFRSPGHGRIDFEGLIRQLNHAGYQGPLTVEWEDPMMEREHGAREAASFTRKLDFAQSAIAFDKAFERG